jgi:hypothetical protein
MASAANFGTKITTTIVRATGSLELDGGSTPLPFEWQGVVTDGGKPAVTLSVVHPTSKEVYQAALETEMAAADMDALMQETLFFRYSRDLNHYTVISDHPWLSGGVRLSGSTPSPPQPTASELLQEELARERAEHNRMRAQLVAAHSQERAKQTATRKFLTEELAACRSAAVYEATSTSNYWGDSNLRNRQNGVIQRVDKMLARLK